MCVPNVNCESKAVQEVCTQDGLLDIGNGEHPPEGATKPNAQCAGTYTIGRDLSAIHPLQGESRLWVGAFRACWGNNADLRPSVNQEASVAVAVMYVK